VPGASGTQQKAPGTKGNMDLANKKVTVIGLGKSGLAAALLLKEHGAEVRVSDSAKNAELEENTRQLANQSIEFELSSHTEAFINGSDLVVASPGVGISSQPLIWAREKNIPVIGEIELAYSFCPSPVIAISGTNGKSTVTTLIGEIFRKKLGDEKVKVGGNIGVPFSSIIPGLGEDSIAILEISSFQLERVKSFKPKISCLLNVTQDHLDRYTSMDEYFDTKKRIFNNQEEDDFAILNYDMPKIKSLKEEIKPKTLYFSKHRLPKSCDGAYVENGQLIIRKDKKFQWVTSIEELSFEGDHNIQNALAAVLAGFLLEIEPDIMRQALLDFKSLPHRFQTVEVINGVRFIDDSKATNIDSVIKALDCCHNGVVLIAGGRDKGTDYKPLVKAVKQKVKNLILIGEAKEKIAEDLANTKPITFVETIEEAVKLAHDKASKGNIVLLSPICASFDMFSSYKERGEAFRRAVSNLK